MSQKLQGQVAVVTGASKGIGAEIAKQLAAAGAAVVVNYASSKAAADKVVAAITAAGGKALAVQADVAKPADITKLFAESDKAFGPVNILVNNAGIYEFAPLEAINAEHYHKMFNLNVLGLLLTTQEAAKRMTAGGSIINISSTVSKLGIPASTVYTATKCAVDGITRCLASELGPRQIRVNAVNPGMVLTEGNTMAAEESEFRAQMEKQTPLGRIGRVDDIAPAVVFLASEDSKWMTGEVMYICGGYR
jgi:3-oxoacyl-[acyl-carrier protein] reductase